MGKKKRFVRVMLDHVSGQACFTFFLWLAGIWLYQKSTPLLSKTKQTKKNKNKNIRTYVKCNKNIRTYVKCNSNLIYWPSCELLSFPLLPFFCFWGLLLSRPLSYCTYILTYVRVRVHMMYVHVCPAYFKNYNKCHLYGMYAYASFPHLWYFVVSLKSLSNFFFYSSRK